MSYSRWSNSRWYTFWSAAEACEKNREVFDICTVCQFTYYQLKNDLGSCLARVRKLDSKATDLEIDELEVYMKLFMKDIDEHYSKGTVSL
jgi:hypothetical protein